MTYRTMVGRTLWSFPDLKTVLGKATPLRSGDVLAGLAAESEEERAVAKLCLADVPLKDFLRETFIPYETDEVTRLIIDTHDPQAFAPVSHLTRRRASATGCCREAATPTASDGAGAGPHARDGGGGLARSCAIRI